MEAFLLELVLVLRGGIPQDTAVSHESIYPSLWSFPFCSLGFTDKIVPHPKYGEARTPEEDLAEAAEQAGCAVNVAARWRDLCPCRATESQNSVGWKGPLKAIQTQPSATS